MIKFTVKKVEDTNITADDIKQFATVLSGDVSFFNDTEKRMICVKDLVLANPIIKDSKNPTLYWEKDTYKPNKVRKVVRFSYILVGTDNLGDVEFKSDKETWKDVDQLMSDEGLLECVMVQRLVDAIDGIDITHPTRRYNPQVQSEKYGRNQKVMLQSPEGDTMFVKKKQARPYLEMGYTIL